MSSAEIPTLSPWAIPAVLAHPFNDGSGVALTYAGAPDGMVALLTSFEVCVNDATADDTLEVILIVDGTTTIWHEHASYVAADNGTVIFWRGCVVLGSGEPFSIQGQLAAETTAVLGVSASVFLVPLTTVGV